jgi:hypothetical protein
MKWKRRFVMSNAGKPIPEWHCEEGFSICENINRGKPDGWLHEIKLKGRYVGEAKELAGAKRIAEALYALDTEL